MTSVPPQHSARSLSELGRLIFSHEPLINGRLEQPAWVKTFDTWLMRIIVGGFLLLLLAGPPVAVLAAFGINYTVQWLVIGFWLLMLGLLLAGVSLLVNWAAGARTSTGAALGTIDLLSSIGLISVALFISWMVWTTMSDPPPSVPVPVVLWVGAVLALLMLGCSVGKLLLIRAPLLRWLQELSSIIVLGGGLLLTVLTQHSEIVGVMPETAWRLQDYWLVLLLALAVLGYWPLIRQREWRWNRNALLLLGAVLLALLVVALLMGWRG